MDAQQVNKKKALFEGFSLFTIVLLLFIIAFTSVATGSPIMLVLIGFSPTLVTIIAGIIIYEELVHSKVIIWFLPFLLAGLFFYVLTTQEFLNYNIKVGTLTAINIILSIIYLTVFTVFFKLLNSQKKRPKGAVRAVVHHQPLSIREYVASIEDKSKALNFAIGRVYSKFHNGTKEMRDKILINKDWYNEFSDILQSEGEKVEQIKDNKKAISAVYVVNKIEDRLRTLLKTEHEVFGVKAQNLTKIMRDPSGHERIIDVLKNNDKDPVESYYKGALEFCNKLKEKLNVKVDGK